MATCTSTSSVSVYLLFIDPIMSLVKSVFLNKGIVNSCSWNSDVMISLVENRLYRTLSRHPTHRWMCVIVCLHVNVWIRAGPKQTRHVCTWNIQTCGVNVTRPHVSLWKTPASSTAAPSPAEALLHLSQINRFDGNIFKCFYHLFNFKFTQFPFF